MKNKTAVRTKYSLLRIGKILLFLCIFIYLIVNLVLSQLISPLYFSLVKNDRTAVVSFLSQIKNLPVFPEFFSLNKNIYGNSLEQEVFAKDLQRKEEIAELEYLLEKNAKARDVLYNLYLLYNEDGNKSKAEEYLRRAKEIDPAIKN